MEPKYIQEFIDNFSKKTQPLFERQQQIKNMISEANKQLEKIKISRNSGTMEERMQNETKLATIPTIIENLNDDLKKAEKDWEELWNSTENRNEYYKAFSDAKRYVTSAQFNIYKKITKKMITKDLKESIKKFKDEADKAHNIAINQLEFLETGRTRSGLSFNQELNDFRKALTKQGNQQIMFTFADSIIKEFKDQLYETMKKEGYIFEEPNRYNTHIF